MLSIRSQLVNLNREVKNSNVNQDLKIHILEMVKALNGKEHKKVKHTAKVYVSWI